MLSSLQKYQQVASIVELRTKIISLSSLVLAALYLVWRGKHLNIGFFTLFSATVLLLDMACTGFNTFFDFWNGTDNKDHNHESDKVLVHQGVSPGFALAVSLIFFGLAAMGGLLLLFLSGAQIFVLGLASFLVAFLYTGGPFPLSRGPLGELFAGAFLGLVLFSVANQVGTDSLDQASILTALPLALWIASILAANNACDRVSDALNGRKTFAVLLGAMWAQIYVYFWITSGFVLALVYSLTGVFAKWSVLLLPLALFFVVPQQIAIRRMGFNNKSKRLVMQKSLATFVVLVLAVLFGFIFDLVVD